MRKSRKLYKVVLKEEEIFASQRKQGLFGEEKMVSGKGRKASSKNSEKLVCLAHSGEEQTSAGEEAKGCQCKVVYVLLCI